MTESVSTQKLLHKIVVRSKPTIEEISICYQESRLFKVKIRLTWEIGSLLWVVSQRRIEEKPLLHLRWGPLLH